MKFRTTGLLIITALSAYVVYNCSGNQAELQKINKDQEKIELGKRLFFDKRLSSDNTVSCASCHNPDRAFTDGKVLGTGVKGRTTFRNVPGLLNVKYLKKLMFDAELTSLERQILVPLLDHAEMNADLPVLFRKLRKDSYYVTAAKRIFNRPFDSYVLTRSIAAYERRLIAMNSRYDQFLKGNKNALTLNEIKGMQLFTKELYCTKCHELPNFTSFKAENNGLYTDYGSDQGRFRVTGLESDKGKFKVPGLRNVELTAPYMHDGSFATLLEVIRHYESGGKDHPNKSAVIQPFNLTSEEEQNLVLFLKTLTDTIVRK